MTSRPNTFGELIRRIAPAADNVYRLAPLVATAAEVVNASSGTQANDRQPSGAQRPFWVVVHSVTDRGLKLLHAKPLQTHHISLRIAVEGGAVVQTTLAISDSQSHGQLYETEAHFQHARLDVASLS